MTAASLPVEFVDFVPLLSDPLGITQAKYFGDGAHLAAAAYFEVIFPVLHEHGIR